LAKYDFLCGKVTTSLPVGLMTPANSFYIKVLQQTAQKSKESNASTKYQTCDEQLSPYGGLWAVIKFFDLVKFKVIMSILRKRVWQLCSIK